MLYFDLKTWHVLVGVILVFSCIWSIYPVVVFRLSDFSDKHKGCLLSACKRAVFLVVPIGVVQSLLGFLTLSVEPAAAPAAHVIELLSQVVLLSIGWLSLVGVWCRWHRNCVNEASITDHSIFWRVTQALLIFISVFFVCFIYVMANFNSA